ncbi:CoA transferase, partial [Streptomyces sp. S12]|nr:CoA transferase [Streptomyces sp. S12]
QAAAEIVPQLHAALAARTALEWEAAFGDEVPCAAARRIEDMFEHPQVLAEGIVAPIEHPGVGRYRGVAQSIKFGRTPGPAPFAAPALRAQPAPYSALDSPCSELTSASATSLVCSAT